MLKSQ